MCRPSRAGEGIDTLGTRGFSRAQRDDFLAEGRATSSETAIRNKDLTWPKPETAQEKSLVPRIKD